MTVTHSLQDQQIEDWLDGLDVKWRFTPDLVLSRVDQHTSLANQARRIALNEDVVETYAADMARGAVFPALLAWDVGEELVSLLGGNHRYAAHLSVGHTTAPAYVVFDLEPALVPRLRFESNRYHGLPPTPAERIDHAVALMEAGSTQAEAAAIVGVPATKLSIAHACIRAGARARSLDVDERYHRLPEAVRYQLSMIDHDEVFVAAADVAAGAGLSITTVKPMVAAAKAVEPAEALRIIGAEAEDHRGRAAHRGGGVRAPSRSARAVLDSALASVRGVDPAAVVASCPSADVRAVLAQRILDTAAVMQACHRALTAPT